MKNEYLKQAEGFLTATGTMLNIKYLRTAPYFSDDKESRDIYEFTLKNSRGEYTSTFGDSLNNTKKRIKPTSYDILACIEKYEPDPSFSNWCAECGYDSAPMADYPKIRASHDAVIEQYKGIRRLFTDEQMEQLQEIQ